MNPLENQTNILENQMNPLEKLITNFLAAHGGSRSHLLFLVFIGIFGVPRHSNRDLAVSQHVLTGIWKGALGIQKLLIGIWGSPRIT